MEIAPRWARPWRWLVLLGAVALLAAMPAVVSALPVSAPSLPAAELLAKVRGSTATPYQGYAESRASLGLPDLPVVGRQTALLGAITRIRAWVASPTLWRVDELTAIGERDLYQDESGTLEWDSGSNRVERTIGEPVVRSTRLEPESHSSVPDSSWYRSRSPMAVSSSTRHRVGLATHARIRVIAPSSAVCRPTTGRSGRPRLALDSA